MTNYNERLDEIIARLRNIGTEAYNKAYEVHGSNGYERVGLQMEIEDKIADEAKAALTSLIKELVAEAKPERRTPDYYSDSIDLYSRQCAANSWNKAIDDFEQNLLKALEEK